MPYIINVHSKKSQKPETRNYEHFDLTDQKYEIIHFEHVQVRQWFRSHTHGKWLTKTSKNHGITIELVKDKEKSMFHKNITHFVLPQDQFVLVVKDAPFNHNY